MLEAILQLRERHDHLDLHATISQSGLPRRLHTPIMDLRTFCVGLCAVAKDENRRPALVSSCRLSEQEYV